MYSESDLDQAVAAGALSAEAAAAFRRHVALNRHAPAVDEEHFRLLTGFNDIFVSIAIVLVLGALARLGGGLADAVGGIAVAAGAWGLAGYFTARRRMALPSIILLVAFVGGVAGAMIAAIYGHGVDFGERGQALIGAGIALATAAAAWLHWRRFMVPITIAAGAAALAAMLIALVVAAIPRAADAVWVMLFLAGLAVFALAMRWDMSDPERRTRRADVAFWLHLAAAPMIAHPLFKLLGVFGEQIGVGTALAVLALYCAFAYVALAVDRRALLVSSLAYVIYAMVTLFRTAGAVELSAALTAFVIGAALLMLSAFWHTMRRLVVGTLGSVATRLPPLAAA